MSADRKATVSRLFTWRGDIVDSDLPPTSRHVALTLSLHMNERGDSCFPSLMTLAAETGLSKSTVAEHLARLEREGWLVRQTGGGRSRDGDGRGRSTRYITNNPNVNRPDPVENTQSEVVHSVEESPGQELSGSRTVDPEDVDTVRLTPRYCPADTPILSGSRTRGRHEDVNRSSSSARETKPTPVLADGTTDDDEIDPLVKLVSAKVRQRATRDGGRMPGRGYGLRCAANLQPGGPDAHQPAELVALRAKHPELTWEQAADVVIGALTLPGAAQLAPVLSIEERNARSHVAALVMTGAIDEARDWIDTDCPPSARAAARLELDRRTGARSAS
jgi:DNA-binding transcriptional regulator YhcF (GntR family)